MKRERQDWRNTGPGTWQLFAADGITVIAEVYPVQADVFAGWGWSVWGYRGFGIFSEARDAKIRCGEMVLERVANRNLKSQQSDSMRSFLNKRRASLP